MVSAEGRSFVGSGAGYDAFMGRFSAGLSAPLIEFAELPAGATVLDLGCGPGALSSELVERFGADSVLACDPSPPFVEAYAERFPQVDVRPGAAEDIPFGDDSCDAVLAQLVLHFVSDPELVMQQICRVTRPGGVVAACVWELGSMELVRLLREAAATVVDMPAPTAARRRFGTAEGIGDLFRQAGCTQVREGRLKARVRYADFEELWTAIEGGTGPLHAQLGELTSSQSDEVRARLLELLGSPTGEFTLTGVAGVAAARTP